MIVFSHIIKNGGTTIVNILRNNFGTKYILLAGHKIHNSQQYTKIEKRNTSILSDIDLINIKDFYDTAHAISGHSIRPHVKLDWSKLSNTGKVINLIFLRDPINRFMSSYNHYVNKHKVYDLTIEDYLLKRKNDTQCIWISNNNSFEKSYNILKKSNYFVGLVEDFDRSIILFKNFYEKTFNVSFNGQYEKSNAQKKAFRTKNSLSKKQIKTLNEFFQEDYKLINKVKHEIYAKQIKDFDEVSSNLNEKQLNYSFPKLKIEIIKNIQKLKRFVFNKNFKTSK